MKNVISSCQGKEQNVVKHRNNLNKQISLDYLTTIVV